MSRGGKTNGTRFVLTTTLAVAAPGAPKRGFRWSLSLPALVVALLAAQGCDTDKLGAPCTLGATGPMSTVSYVESNALACPSRLCLLPAAQLTTDTQPLCSATCRTDDDCQGGQSRNRSDPTDRRCIRGFSCRPVIPALPDAQPCQKLCACRDFFDDSQPSPISCP